MPFRKVTHLLVFLVLYGVLASAGFAQIPTPSRGSLRFYVDTNSFKALDVRGKTYQEFYFTLNSNQLKFVPKDHKFVAIVQILGRLSNVNGEFVDSLKSTLPVVVDSLPKHGRSIFHNFGRYLLPGHYILTVRLRDYHSGRVGEKRLPISVRAFSEKHLCLSELQLGAKIFSDTARTQFYKNGLQVVPNPLRLFGTHLPLLYTYAEIYNLPPGQASAALRISYTVLDSSDRPFEQLFTGRLTYSGRTAVEARAFNVLGFPSGTYTLRLVAHILGTRDSTAVQRTFRVLNWSDWLSSHQKKRNTASKTQLSDAQLEKTVAQVSYLLTRSQQKTLHSLNRAGKIRFLARFWENRDPDPDTPINEFQQEFYKRVNYANRHYGAHNLEGWQTDRGRILILYGPPDEIERNRFELDYKPYEIWHYDRLGGRICVFADLEGYGIYTLIHSTFDNEVHDPEWKERIYFVRTK